MENLVFIDMIQQFGSTLPNVRAGSKRLLYQAILDPYGIQFLTALHLLKLILIIDMIEFEISTSRLVSNPNSG